MNNTRFVGLLHRIISYLALTITLILAFLQFFFAIRPTVYSKFNEALSGHAML